MHGCCTIFLHTLINWSFQLAKRYPSYSHPTANTGKYCQCDVIKLREMRGKVGNKPPNKEIKGIITHFYDVTCHFLGDFLIYNSKMKIDYSKFTSANFGIYGRNR